jgi:hypothetical protein
MTASQVKNELGWQSFTFTQEKEAARETLKEVRERKAGTQN